MNDELEETEPLEQRVEITGWGYLDFDPNEKRYLEGDRLSYEGAVYVVLQNHVSSGAHLPDTSPDLYRHSLEPPYRETSNQRAGTLRNRARTAKLK